MYVGESRGLWTRGYDFTSTNSLFLLPVTTVSQYSKD